MTRFRGTSPIPVLLTLRERAQGGSGLDVANPRQTAHQTGIEVSTRLSKLRGCRFEGQDRYLVSRDRKKPKL